jgi:uncharacterized YigZ family protein
MQGETYKTITNSSEGIYKDKGSKFLAYAYPVSSEDEVKAHLEALRKEHHSARHHCWAYKLGNKGEVYRCSDDGEPTNSAGKPILGQLEAFDVTNVAVVVVRYFGGVLLGVGGLIQAYKEAAKSALASSEIVERIVEVHFKIEYTYEQSSAVQIVLKRYKCAVRSQSYTDVCSIHFSVAKSNADDCVLAFQQINIKAENE